MFYGIGRGELIEAARDIMKNTLMFTTGIENSYPTIMVDGKKVRVDEMEKTGHYKRWKEDFASVKHMGIEFLRYGPPYYSTHLGPDKYDWSFADETMNALDSMFITPIVDLCHFGVNADGSRSASGEIFDYYVIMRQYYERYRLPVMHTETNIAEPYSVAWLRKEWADLYHFEQDGLPIVGFTWFSLLDQVDWDSALCINAGKVNALGLYDLNRNIRDVGTAYKQLIQAWRPVLAEESFKLQSYL